MKDSVEKIKKRGKSTILRQLTDRIEMGKPSIPIQSTRNIAFEGIPTKPIRIMIHDGHGKVLITRLRQSSSHQSVVMRMNSRSWI